MKEVKYFKFDSFPSDKRKDIMELLSVVKDLVELFCSLGFSLELFTVINYLKSKQCGKCDRHLHDSKTHLTKEGKAIFDLLYGGDNDKEKSN